MSTASQPGGESDRIAVWEGSTVIGYVSSGTIDGVTRWHSWRDRTDTVGCGAHQDQAQAERYLLTLAGGTPAVTRSSADAATSSAGSGKKPVKRVGQRGV